MVCSGLNGYLTIHCNGPFSWLLPMEDSSINGNSASQMEAQYSASLSDLSSVTVCRRSVGRSRSVGQYWSTDSAHAGYYHSSLLRLSNAYTAKQTKQHLHVYGMHLPSSWLHDLTVSTVLRVREGDSLAHQWVLLAHLPPITNLHHDGLSSERGRSSASPGQKFAIKQKNNDVYNYAHKCEAHQWNKRSWNDILLL